VRFYGCLLAATLASLTLAGSAAATFPGKNGKLSFHRFVEEGESVNIFTVTPGRSDVFNVTPFGPGVFAVFSDWSPDGERLAIDSDRTGQVQVYLIDPDGTDLRQLTDAANGAFDPAWAPDGRTLAIDSDFGEDPGIFLIPARTKHGELITTASQARRVTRVTDGGYDSEPQFSRDGKWIVFTRFSVECTDDATFDNCTTRILRVRTNGSRLQQLTRPELNASAPDYHPSGRYITFDTHDNFVAPNVGHIMVMDDDGSDKRVILRGDADDHYGNPSFSPDGRAVAFTRFNALEDAPSNIWVARADGRHARQVTSSPTFDNKVDWGPASRRRHR
jgi:TolB protein